VNRPPLGTSVIVGALVLGSVLTGSSDGSADRIGAGGAQSVEVVGVTAVCPDIRQRPGMIASRVSVGAAPLPAGRSGADGAVAAVPVGRGGADQQVGVTGPGQVAVGLATKISNDGLVLSATGGLAAGLEVEQVTRGSAGAERGLAGVRCEAPARESWFVGGATAVGDITHLVLANVDDTPSTVDVSIFSARGAADSRLGQGITVRPHSRTVINLDELAPDQRMLAVRVLSRRGRVAAALKHARLDGRTTKGVDYVPRSVPPASSVVVPGFPRGPGTRVLLIANPGADATTIKVRVTTADGQFVPTGFDDVLVPAGTAIGLRLDGLTNISPLAATVTSDGAPIIAGGVVHDRQDSRIQEMAYTGGSRPLSGPALLTDLVIDRPTESTLILSALEAAATMRVTPIRVLGTVGALPAPKLLTVPAGRTATLRLSTFYPPGTKTRLAVEVAALDGSGPVYAARYLRERAASGPLTTLLDLQGPAQRVSRPLVYRDPSLGS